MMKVGLTGGLGSGKSTVAKVFETLRIPVFYADEEAKNIVNSSVEVKQNLISAFGPELFTGGQINRAHLASIIFKNADAMKTVNGIIHPAVAEAFARWAEHQNSPYVLQEAAILFETGSYTRFAKMILVSAPEELRMARVMARSGWSRDEILQRMVNQWGENQKIALADFVILNDGSKPLLPQILAVHENLIRTANQGG